MPRLTPSQRKEILERRGNKSANTDKKHPISNLEIHHMNRNPEDNRPQNLKVLTKAEHDKLHARAKR